MDMRQCWINASTFNPSSLSDALSCFTVYPVSSLDNVEHFMIMTVAFCAVSIHLLVNGQKCLVILYCNTISTSMLFSPHFLRRGGIREILITNVAVLRIYHTHQIMFYQTAVSYLLNNCIHCGLI